MIFELDPPQSAGRWPVAGPAGPVTRLHKSQRAGSDHSVESKERFEQEVVAPDELV